MREDQGAVDGALFEIFGRQARAVFVALHHVFLRVHPEVALVFFGTVAVRAGRFEDGLDLRIEVDLLSRRSRERGQCKEGYGQWKMV